MEKWGKEIFALLQVMAMENITGTNAAAVAQYNAVCAILVRAGVPFDSSFTGGNRKDGSSLQITVHINPQTALTYTFDGS